MRRRYAVGAETQNDGSTHFRVWAPLASELAVVRDDQPDAPLSSEGNGYFAGLVTGCGAGQRYRLQIDNGSAYPDPVSRFQPDGPHGPSQVVDPSTFAWTDATWPGVTKSGLVLYELHIGTFTREGTWASAARELEPLAELGVTAVEIMPIADFPGRFGWGYDGVNFFAPTRLYGTPDDLRQFVNTAHTLGLGVILDVVYNHFGPDGCFIENFSPYYFAESATDWGRALNFDGPHSAGVREYMTANAAHWIDEYHFDGLRLDATHAMVDRSTPHIIAEIGAAVRQAAGPRATWIVCENEQQVNTLIRSEADGGYGMDAVWNDDFHHNAMVAATGRREAYYTDYFGSPQEFISAAKHGFLYQGQWYSWQEKGRGTPTIGMPYDHFVTFLQNHDQLGNSLTGTRLHQLTSAGRLRALTAVLLLGPGVPMLFQGQEFASSSPFLFFADHNEELNKGIREGRRQELSQFASIAAADEAGFRTDPCDPATFERCKLDHDERRASSHMVALHASLLELRASDPVFRAQGRHCFDGAVIGPQAFVFRYFGKPGCDPNLDDRLLVVNLGVQIDLHIMPEPLLAAPQGCHWTVLWSSDDPMYGGGGTLKVIRPTGWSLPPECALVLAPVSYLPR